MTEVEKVFKEADIAGKRAEELQMWVNSYKYAIRDLEISKAHLKSIVDQAKNKGFSKDILNAVLASGSLLGVEKMAFLSVINPETPEKTDDSENPNCDEEPTTDSENESVADEGVDTCEE